MYRWIELNKARERELSEILREFVSRRCGEADVVLFGSRARGDFHALSDWDIALISREGAYVVA
ncbi:MAG: nucleotidyltransferase domain-containing protein [Thermoproteus sp.]